jgi:GT2 family glycosyltransferase
MSGSAPAVSVVIPSFQSSSTIEACLDALVAQRLGETFEVIVVDSGTDATASLVRDRYPAVRLLKADRRLDPATARNWGAREARAPILAFLDSDCVPAAHWLERLRAALENGRYDAVGGAIRNGGATLTGASWAGYFCEFREFLPRGIAVQAANVTLGNAAYRREVFERAGRFPEGYFPQEDQVFHVRFLAAGGRICFNPEIVVDHTHRSGVRAFLAHQVRIGRANARVVCALGLNGAAIASRRWLATLLLPALASYRFARTVMVCWAEERCLLCRRPDVAILCWLGMIAWGVGFAGFTEAGASARR